MRIAVISQWYPPEPAFVPGELATELAARGHRVRVLTTFPNYPTGRTYPGYRQRWRSEESAGRLTVRRVPIYPSYDQSALGRMASYLSFAATSTAAALRYLRGVDAIYVYHPPVTAFTAALLPRLRGVPVLLHVQDVWPESVTASQIAPTGRLGRAVDRALTTVMRRAYRAASGLIAISPGMAELLVERGAHPGTVRTVPNWTDERLFRPTEATPAARAELGHRGRCTVMFAGNLGPFQRVETAVRAAALLSNRVDLVFVGSGTEEDAARALATELGADNIRFLGRRPPPQMADLYAAAEFQLVTLRDLPALRGTVPSKLPAALACGVPVVVSAAGDVAQFVAAHRVGLHCPPEDWQALAGRLAEAAAMPEPARIELGRRARQVYLDTMSLRAGVDQIEEMLVKMSLERRNR